MKSAVDTVLLFSLPASGKSEVRTYLSSLSEAQCREEFGIGPTLQLDDYPYVHLMHRIDDELRAAGWHDVYYFGPNRPFRDGWTWAALIELLNEDYDDLLHQRVKAPASAAEHLFDRLDAAHLAVGAHDSLADVPHRVRRKVAAALEKEARHELELLNSTFAQDRAGRTIVIECARGGPNGAAFPLTPPHGYITAFNQLSVDILDRATVLYVWVDPAESRRKNIERGRPDGAGSILHHSVPMEVMLGQYGCDDMAWFIESSDRPDTVRIDRVVPEGDHHVARTWHLPAARFDNRRDLTTFVRKPRAEWGAAEIAALHAGLGDAFRRL